MKHELKYDVNNSTALWNKCALCDCHTNKENPCYTIINTDYYFDMDVSLCAHCIEQIGNWDFTAINGVSKIIRKKEIKECENGDEDFDTKTLL